MSNLDHEKSKAQPKEIVISAFTFSPLNFGPKRIKVLSITKVLWKFWSKKNKSTVYDNNPMGYYFAKLIRMYT